MSRAEYLRPSSAATWVRCFGYAAMRAAYPEVPEEADEEIREDGTACHWLASELWQGRHVAEDSLSPNNRICDEQMFDAVDIYHGLLWSWIDNDISRKQEVICEQQVPCHIIYNVEGMPDGTPDAYQVLPHIRTIRVGDLKYGFRFVEAWENWQGIIYLLAIAAMQGINAFEEEHWWAEFYIVQPRSNHRDGPVRKWRVRLSDLRAHLNILNAAAAQSLKDNPECTPNPGCMDCPGRHACQSLQNAALSALEVSYQATPHELEPAALGDELKRLKHARDMLDGRITGLEASAEAQIKAGVYIPGWTLATTYARERWIDGGEMQIMTIAHAYFQADIAKPRKAITPNQARKILPANIVAAFSHKPSTGVKLTKQDPYEAKKKFGSGI